MQSIETFAVLGDYVFINIVGTCHITSSICSKRDWVITCEILVYTGLDPDNP